MGRSTGKTTRKDSFSSRKSIKKPLIITRTIKTRSTSKSQKKTNASPKTQPKSAKTKKSQTSVVQPNKKKQQLATPKTQKAMKKPPNKNARKAPKKDITPKYGLRSSISQSVFEKEVMTTYQKLEYAQKFETEVTQFTSDEMTHIEERSPDLFETDPNEYENNNNVQTVSIGIQCVREIETRDSQVNTCELMKIDVGVQTSPLVSSTGTTVERCDDGYDDSEFENFDDFIESSECQSSCESDSSTNLDEFDMLENLEVNVNSGKSILEYVKNDGHECAEDTSTIIGSPPRNQIYKNRKFRSPDSLQI